MRQHRYSEGFRLLVHLILLGGICGVVTEAAPPPSRTNFEVRYRQMDAAFLRKDARAFVSYCAQDVVAVDGDKTFQNRNDFENQMSSLIRSIDKVTVARTAIRRFSADGEIVRIDFTMHFVGDLKDPAGKDPQLHHYDTYMNFHNDWTVVSGEWRIIRYTTAGQSGTIDGKHISEELSKQ